MPGHDIIVIGASTGGVEALRQLVRDLPPNLPAALLVVLHIPPQGSSRLPHILSRAGVLPAEHPFDGESIKPGRIYVAPPDWHMMVEPGRIHLSHGPRENRTRPAVDPLFRSAARAYGPRVVGVVLTGGLDDGAAGLQAIKQRGGIAIVQDPWEALIASMPASALEYVKVDYCVPLAEMPALLARLASDPAEREEADRVPRDMDIESRLTASDKALLESTERPGTLSPFTCPECKGPLRELRDGELVRYRCRQGHAFSIESMVAEQSLAVEDALWTALNILEENTQMLQKLIHDARSRRLEHLANRFQKRVGERLEQARLLRQVLLNGRAEAPVESITTEELKQQE